MIEEDPSLQKESLSLLTLSDTTFILKGLAKVKERLSIAKRLLFSEGSSRCFWIKSEVVLMAQSVLSELLMYGPIRYIKIPLHSKSCFVMFMHYEAAQRAYERLSSGGEEFRFLKVTLLDERIGHLEVTTRESYKRWKQSFQPHAVALFPQNNFQDSQPQPFLPQQPSLFLIPDVELELFAVDSDTLSLPRLPDNFGTIVEEEQNRLKYAATQRDKKKEREERNRENKETSEKTHQERKEKYKREKEQKRTEMNQTILREIRFEPKVQENMRELQQVYKMTQAEPRLFYKPRDVSGPIEEGELVTSEEQFNYRSRSSSPFEKRDSPRYSDRSPYYSPARSTHYRSNSYAKQRGFAQESFRDYSSEHRNREFYRYSENEYESRYEEDSWYYKRGRYRGRPAPYRYGRGSYRSRGRGSRWFGESDYF